MDTFAAGLVAFVLAMQWRWYISVRRDVKLIKKSALVGIIEKAVPREVDLAPFALLGRDRKPESPKVSPSPFRPPGARARSGRTLTAPA